MNQVEINIDIFSDSLGNEWSDVDTAGDAYAKFLENKLADEFAGHNIDASVSVDYKNNMAGAAPTSILADDYDSERAARDIVETVSEKAWDEFCASGVGKPADHPPR